ncbi:hypothetical protein Tco_0656092 [Tanacetum coccineum]|uniref:Retrotransposon gag domain-containing protein n=1 Tax=Tanacetum coccineum TaxID=301880 RepID=A0ABQ4X8B2_9ASTR
MRESREDTFFGNKNEDAHDYNDRVLSIVSLFNILEVSKEVVMLRVFPFTLTGSAKRWVDRLAPRTIDIWDLLKKAFIQSFAHPSKPQSCLKIFTTSSKKETNHYTMPRSSIMTCYTRTNSWDDTGPSSHNNDHSQKWHDGTTSRIIRSSSSNDGLAALVNKLGNLGRDMKKLKESVHAIQEVKQVEEARYGEFRRTTPFNKNNRGKFRVGPPGYYTKTDNRSSYGERRQGLEELLAKHQENSAQRSTEIEVWIKKLQENAKINTRNQSASLKN